jgi:Sec7-like guanine-nucleotide exchange factor
MKFSKKYYNDNSKIEGCPFMNEDQVSTLAYSILMLNTDLHNPNLTKHMTMEEFVKNNLSTKLYDEFPCDYFRSIYKSIASTPLKVANSRSGDYSKTEEVFLVLRSKNYYCDKSNSQDDSESHKNIFNQVYHFQEIENPSSSASAPANCFNLLKYTSLNMFEDFSHCSKEINSNVKTVYFLLWEDLFYNFMSMPYKFYEMKDDNTLKVLEKVCLISQNFNQKENIDKLIVRNFMIYIFR